MTDRPIFVDIDGTLTRDAEQPWGPPRYGRIHRLKKLIERGIQVVVWSGGGTTYAKAFCEHYSIKAVALGKPEMMVDDNPTIRPEGRMRRVMPATFFGDTDDAA